MLENERLKWERAMCTGKRPWASRREALQANKAAQNHGFPAMQAYRCWFCDQWHLGHKHKRCKKPARGGMR